MKRGEGCRNLYFFEIGGHDANSQNMCGYMNKPKAYRCCIKRAGFMLKMWRCLGKDDPKCPGFEPKLTKPTHIEDGETK